MQEQSGNEILITQDGSHSLLSKRFGVSYHSKYGAVQESMHVFIKAGLHPALQKKSATIRVLEFGFGTGLNALLTLLTSQKTGRDIYYEGIEAYPIDLTTVDELNYAEVLGKTASDFRQLHESTWGDVHQLIPQFSYKKVKALFQDCTFPEQFDVCYFDAFAPTSQPELWEKEVLQLAYDALLPGGIFVTYCAKGAVKRNLKALGFKVEALAGPPGKREMTRGIK